MENGSSADDKFTIDALLKQSWQYKGSSQFTYNCLFLKEFISASSMHRVISLC